MKKFFAFTEKRRYEIAQKPTKVNDLTKSTFFNF